MQTQRAGPFGATAGGRGALTSGAPGAGPTPDLGGGGGAGGGGERPALMTVDSARWDWPSRARH